MHSNIRIRCGQRKYVDHFQGFVGVDHHPFVPPHNRIIPGLSFTSALIFFHRVQQWALNVSVFADYWDAGHTTFHHQTFVATADIGFARPHPPPFTPSDQEIDLVSTLGLDIGPPSNQGMVDFNRTMSAHLDGVDNSSNFQLSFSLGCQSMDWDSVAGLFYPGQADLQIQDLTAPNLYETFGARCDALFATLPIWPGVVSVSTGGLYPDFNLYSDGLYGFVDPAVPGNSMTFTISLTATKFWPYVNRAGQLVYDGTTGAQIHDPFG
jgi:hypothetical protein